MKNHYHKVAVASICTALGFVLGASPEAKAASFTLTSPVFEVLDLEDLEGSYYGIPTSFDGLGDKVFPGGGFVIKGTSGEAAQLIEFNIGSLFMEPNTVINNAVFQTKIGPYPVGGLGVGILDKPGSLGIFGYVGNGTIKASDFEAGVFLSSVDISSLSPGDTFNFDVTPFINQRLSNGDAFAGFAIRALNFGGTGLGGPENFGRPSLIVETADVAEPVPEPTAIFGSAIALGLGGWLKRKKSNPQNKTTPQH